MNINEEFNLPFIEFKVKFNFGIPLFFIFIITTTYAQKFSFSVLADPRDDTYTWRHALTEIRDMNFNPDPMFTPAEFVIAAGDIDPLDERYNDFKEIFADVDSTPCFLPVIGNHEFSDDSIHFFYARDEIIPYIPNTVRRHSESCDYYFDYNNVRIICVDGYSDLGNFGCINSTGLEWVEQVIESSPDSIDHIFVTFHEPAFPRHRHVGDSFDACPEERNTFWNMLIEHKDIVKATLVGHTHYYSRMRVFDPEGICANDIVCYPDDENGIYQIDAGCSGRGEVGDGRNTIVQVQIDSKNIFFRVLDAEDNTNDPFVLKDEWQIIDSHVIFAEITDPFNNSIFTEGDDITISADVSSNYSEIIGVNFFQNGNFIATDNEKPYIIVWENVSEGNFMLTVKVTDSNDSTVNSEPVNIIVKPPSIFSSIDITPKTANVYAGKRQQFIATARDQFGCLMENGQWSFKWSIKGCGIINQNGFFTAGDTAGVCTVTVSADSITETSRIIVLMPEQTTYTFNLFTLQGRKIISEEFTGSYLLNTENISPGIYIMRIIDRYMNIIELKVIPGNITKAKISIDKS